MSNEKMKRSSFEELRTRCNRTNLKPVDAQNTEEIAPGKTAQVRWHKYGQKSSSCLGSLSIKNNVTFVPYPPESTTHVFPSSKKNIAIFYPSRIQGAISGDLKYQRYQGLCSCLIEGFRWQISGCAGATFLTLFFEQSSLTSSTGTACIQNSAGLKWHRCLTSRSHVSLALALLW